MRLRKAIFFGVAVVLVGKCLLRRSLSISILRLRLGTGGEGWELEISYTNKSASSTPFIIESAQAVSLVLQAGFPP
uniref:Uncharacterized protein n=1 Tax=Tolypothrix bouteillei VB521301 TaxID=1479485 RepID=A0A0C1RB00_9CYAN